MNVCWGDVPYTDWSLRSSVSHARSCLDMAVCCCLLTSCSPSLFAFSVSLCREIRNQPEIRPSPLALPRCVIIASSLANSLPIVFHSHHAQQCLHKLLSHHHKRSPEPTPTLSILLRGRTHSHTPRQELYSNTSSQPESQRKRITYGFYSGEAAWGK